MIAAVKCEKWSENNSQVDARLCSTQFVTGELYT